MLEAEKQVREQQISILKTLDPVVIFFFAYKYTSKVVVCVFPPPRPLLSGDGGSRPVALSRGTLSIRLA
jgi:hypothetical protein